MLGANGSWEEVDALGIARFTPGSRIRALEEAIIVVRALACGGEPVTFDGEFYKVTKLMPAAAPTPPVWVGVGGPKGLAVTGRNADGWILPHAANGLTRIGHSDLHLATRDRTQPHIGTTEQDHYEGSNLQVRPAGPGLSNSGPNAPAYEP